MTSAFQSMTDVRSMYMCWPKGLKMLMAFGKKDETLNIEDVLSYARDLVEASQKGDITLKIYDGYHSLTKCSARKPFLTDVLDFIDTILNTKK